MIPRDLLARCASNFPDKIAYYCGERQRTWHEMNQRASQLAAALQKLGAKKSDTVAILGHESFEIYEHFFACMKLGTVRVSVNWRYAPPEVLHVLRDSSAKFLLVQTSTCLDLLSKLEKELAALGIILIGYGGAHDLPHDYETCLSQAANLAPALPPLADDDVLLYSYTSGTTGYPKGAMLTHGAVGRVVFQSLVGFGFHADDIWCMPAQSAWVAVLMNLLGLGNGMSHVIPNGMFEITQFMRDIERLKITSVLLVPTMIYRAIQEHKTGAYDLSSLRLIVYGSSPAAPALIREAYATFGCDMLQTYAMTESTGGWVTYLYPSEHRYALAHEPDLLNSVGRAGVMFELSIRDEAGQRLPPNTKGEIWLKGETLMKGYLNLPEQTADALRGERGEWLCTNDIGRVDERGYLYLMDRKKFMIITGGVNVFPAAVEAIVLEHPAVEEVAVVGAPHPEWGETVVGVAKLKNGAVATSAELVLFCQERLSRAESPKHFLFRDELPKTLTGKMQKNMIKEWVLANANLLPWQV